MTETPRNIDYRLIISGIFELIGIVSITYGAYLIAPFLGFVIAGLSALWVARAIDPPAEPLLASLKKRPKRIVEEEF